MLRKHASCKSLLRQQAVTQLVATATGSKHAKCDQQAGKEDMHGHVGCLSLVLYCQTLNIKCPRVSDMLYSRCKICWCPGHEIITGYGRSRASMLCDMRLILSLHASATMERQPQWTVKSQVDSSYRECTLKSLHYIAVIMLFGLDDVACRFMQSLNQPGSRHPWVGYQTLNSEFSKGSNILRPYNDGPYLEPIVKQI